MPTASIPISCLVLALAASVAHAGAATEVTLPVGDWIAALADVAGLLLLGAAVWALRMLPAPIHRVLMMLRAEQLLRRAVDYGVQGVAGAARGRTLTVDVGNRVVATATRYAVEAADDVVEWLGGEEALRRRIVARLDLEPDAEVSPDADGELLKARRAGRDGRPSAG